MMLPQFIDAGEALVAHALKTGVALAPGDQAVLLDARGRQAALAAPGPAREAFFAALSAVSALVALPAGQLCAGAMRRESLLPEVNASLALLAFAAANAKKLDDENRNTLIASSHAILRGSHTAADEQAFYRAYEQLTLATAPVTAETLESSQTKLPNLAELVSGNGWAALAQLTLGRFVTAVFFVLVLFVTCVALGYQSVGSEMLVRLEEVDGEIARIGDSLHTSNENMLLRKSALAAAEGKKLQVPEELDTAQRQLREAVRVVEKAGRQRDQLEAERASLWPRLGAWARKPCQGILTRLLCADNDAPAGPAAKDAAVVVANWMSAIVLPLMLGLLGACAHVIRQMVAEIQQRTFAKSTSLHHLTRFTLGALAGISSGWLLTPEAVSAQLRNVPAWVLAFVAGYGIELVFAFLDRIISTFTTKAD